ncbi:23S rRNA (adenine(2503)-C(2))-methyltransferase RlmN [Gudongella sp. DL1XJH-153]|uniref:23S rRNA (adenine(2503)-C(2))-methyltransferase RlmN n=1 Tax=Gudongella sp. DL1XJH-153 TaxID=3409804 RepID=UPI003BB5DBF3
MELNSMTQKKLKEIINDYGEKSFRAEQIFRYFHQHDGEDILEIGQIPLDLRKRISLEYTVNKIKVLHKFESKVDGTVKYLFLLPDGNIIESVVMSYSHGYSQCISTQVGCKMGCSFCASTKGGLVRNLTAAEMANQVYEAEKDLGIRISNIVLMGSGEPLDNYDNVVDFFAIINSKLGRNISLRNITLSTCGIVPEIYKLAEENLPITLSISLHSPFDEKREEIMPIARKHKLKELMEALRYYIDKTNRRITFEYTLIKGTNDSEKEAREISRLLDGMLAHVNLIPLNPISEYKEGRPDRDHVLSFQSMLKKFGVATTVRREMGGDISASCGQLRRSVLDEEK